MMVVTGNVGTRASEIGTSSQQTFDHIAVTTFARLNIQTKMKLVSLV
jgi:hypothetical protein